MSEINDFYAAARTLLKVSLATDYYYACHAAHQTGDMSIICQGVKFPDTPINFIHTSRDAPPEKVLEFYDDQREQIDFRYAKYAGIFNSLVGETFSKDRVETLKSQMSEIFQFKIGLRPTSPTHRNFWAEEHQGKIQINVEFSKKKSESFIIRGYSLPHNHLFWNPAPERQIA